MQKSKLKILMCSEASFLHSGFGTYTRELLTRLYKTNKYDIAEFASYGMVNDPRDKNIPWKYYANAVKENDPRHQDYMSRADNQFGRWRFEKVLLDFRPDVVIDVRDYWMSSYQALSPLRKYFHWILMPTVDSAPQQEDWIDTFLSADAIFTYSDWGAEVLKKQSSDKINYIDTASPGVDLSVFKPMDNKPIKSKLGIPEDSIIIGSVMRNQKRKLFPELLIAFRKVLDILEKENHDLGKKLYLYLHTSYPDMGWDLPELLKDNRLSNRVIFSYACRSCAHIEASVYTGPTKFCSKCLSKAMMMPSVTNGISDNSLAEIYNIFDLYIQYAICEGFGMPQVEAGACGVPIATVNYSAMVDIIQKLDAISIEPKSFFKELETKAIRVYPDNDQLADEIIKYISQSSIKIQTNKNKVRSLTEKYYCWDLVAQKWEEYLDKLDQNYRSDWSAPPEYVKYQPPDLNKINSNNLFQVIKDFCRSLSKYRDNYSMRLLSMLQSASYGFFLNGTNVQNYEYQNIIDTIKIEIDNINQAESARCSNAKFNDDFIQYAHIKSHTS